MQDESTSALDVRMEATCMTLCAESGITCVSVGHRPTLRQFHSRVIHLHGDGTTSTD